MERIVLSPIDFSDGIKSEEIQFNFDLVESQLERERLSIAGYGVSSGMELSLSAFKLNIAAGVIVDKLGKEISYDNTVININLPLTEEFEENITVQSDGSMTFGFVPYRVDRLGAADTLPLSDIDNKLITGITVTSTNDNKILPVKSITNNVIVTDARYSGTTVKVKYLYSFNRIDTIYIDENYYIKIAQGTPSTSPSGYIPSNAKYIFGFLNVKPFVLVNNKKMASLTLREDLRRLRNLYTNNENKLFISGISFDDLQIVHMEQPITPSENELWYDKNANQLLVWRTSDGISEWITVNDTSFIPVLEKKIWTAEFLELAYHNGDHDLQTFEFNLEPEAGVVPDLNLLFIPGKNELEIIIDNVLLMSDQFEEIVEADPNSAYQNNGVGFKLVDKLDKPAFVEVRVTHRINHNPLPMRLQRSATFSAEDTNVYVAENVDRIFNAPTDYRYKENQLEVYVEGRKLDVDIDYIEGSDMDQAALKRGVYCKQFKITKSLAINDRVSCKVTANVYSYDNVSMLIGDLGAKITNAINKSNQAEATVNALSTSINTTVDTLEDRIVIAEGKAAEVDNAFKHSDIIPKDNMPVYVNNFIPSGLINTSIIKTSSIMQLTGITDKDYINVFDINVTGGNSILRRDVDYVIEKGSDSLNYIHFQGSFDNSATNNHTLYISGIKLGV